MTVAELVVEARRHGVEFRLDGGVVHVSAPTDELDGWATRLRPHRATILAILVEHAPYGTRGDPLEVARAAAIVGAAIGVLSAGGRLCACCLRIDQCIDCANGTHICWRCVDHARRGS